MSYSKIDPEFKIKWLEALRSGKYSQAIGWLKGLDGGFCCLGVACDISGEGAWNSDRGYKIKNNLNDNADYKILPVELTTKYKIYFGVSGILSRMNDRGESFEDIANWIEENL